MGARGPAPKPTALKELAGNPGKRALNAREPQPRTKRPKMPEHLTDDAKKEWKRLVRELGAMELLTSADADALAMYCQTYDNWVKASKKLADGGMVTKTENGYPIMSPYVTIVNQCLRTMKQLLTEFGMTPASRSRISVPEKPEDDDFDQFLKRR